MVFSLTSVYTLTGDANSTLNTLTNTAVSGSSDLSTLSTTNYVEAGASTPNEANQLIFKNQPLSWWVECLNSGAVKYTPFSSDVNWAFIDANDNAIHISIEISNLLIPNKPESSERDPGSMSYNVTYEPKFGITRLDTHSM
jgi:hypothetical protein